MADVHICECDSAEEKHNERISTLTQSSNIYFPGNGYIEGTELDGFLKEFVSSANATDISPEVQYFLYH